MQSLDDIGRRNGTDKSSLHNDFLRFYEPFLATRRMQRVKILDIGVLGGGSVRTWRDYFPNGEIIGMDINPAAKQHAGERIRIEISDQSNPTHLERIAALGSFDLVLDDGSHVWDHQIATFKALIGHVKPGGVYVIEDLDTSYGRYTEHYRGDGGMSAAAYLHRMCDWVVGHRVMRPEQDPDPRFWPLIDHMSFYRGACLMRIKL